jgi:thiol-disulfide isomerase/thioredoxin
MVFNVVMKPKFQLLLLFCILAATSDAQNHQFHSLNIGEPAPSLRVRKWIKGTPVQHFEKGRVYVVDFWATWCRPCNASMPYTSDLAHKYKDKVTFLAIAIWETGLQYDSKVSMSQIIAFVDSVGQQMDFPVAIDEGNFMANHWIKASDQNSIPTDFVVNAQGRVAWVGNPVDLDTVLSKIVNDTWDIKAASSKRIFNEHLAELDAETWDKLRKYFHYDSLGDYHLVKPDSALLAINEIIKKEPKLKYAPNIALFTFWALLKTNPHKAYEYGEKVIVTSTYQGPAYHFIIGKIEAFSHRFKNSEEIYQLGAEAYQAEIDNTNPVYRKLLDLPEIYRKMAAWYRLAHDNSKAVEAEQNAIKLAKNN